MGEVVVDAGGGSQLGIIMSWGGVEAGIGEEVEGGAREWGHTGLYVRLL